MNSVIWAAGSLCAAASIAHLLSIGLALGHRRTRAAPTPAAGHPPVSIIRPVCGLDFGVEATLRSTFALDDPRCEIVFCVASSADPVVPLVRRLIAEHPHVDAKLLVGNDRVSDNPKLNNVVKGWRAAAHPWIAMVDSNVLLPRDFVRRLFASQAPETGLVSSPPLGAEPDGFPAELECAFLNSYQARWQFAADAIGLGFAQGKLLFAHRDLIEQAGGIGALGAESAEDAAATKIVRAAGLSVNLFDRPLPHPLGSRTFEDVWQRQIRWARLRRATFPAYFFPEIFTGSVFPAACLALFAFALELPVAAFLALFLFAWYGVEALFVYAAGWPRTPHALLAWLVRDLLLPVLWIRAWAGRDFVWRGHAMTADSARDQLARNHAGAQGD
ncbi:MAG: glycosyltransferase [Bradyrhizobiaceae bacterium]|nr:glycosyltransferase [Bradyrhizobiaceae bacterium]